MKFRFQLILLACFWPMLTFAGSTDQARQHYETATAHFAVGEFAEAAAEYQAAFKAKPDPALLYDAAQAYRLANYPEKALILYRNYLQLFPKEANIAEVRAQIEKLKQAIDAAADKARSSPPTDTSAPTHIKPDSSKTETTTHATTEDSRHSSSSQVEPTSQAVKTDRPFRTTPLYKRWWPWTAVGVVVASGVIVAVVLSTKSTGSWANAPDVGPGSRNGLIAAAVRW